MKIVYVLTSGADDLYFEQFWASAFSARKYNPSADIVLLTDKDTENTLQTGYRAKAVSLVTSVVAVDLPADMSRKVRSRHLKTTMREHVAGDFLYIDCDTVICDALDSIESNIGDICMVRNLHVPISSALKTVRQWDAVTKKVGLGYHREVNGVCFNGGLMFTRDTPRAHEFFALWHTLWQETCARGVAEDQPALNEANYRMGGIISEMSGVWNCQVTNGMKYLPHAHIIHYFATGLDGKGELPYAMMNKALLQEMKDKGGVPDSVKRIIDDPKAPELFCDGWLIKASSEKFDVISGEAVWPLLSLRRKHKKLYTALDNMMAVLHGVIMREHG